MGIFRCYNLHGSRDWSDRGNQGMKKWPNHRHTEELGPGVLCVLTGEYQQTGNSACLYCTSELSRQVYCMGLASLLEGVCGGALSGCSHLGGYSCGDALGYSVSLPTEPRERPCHAHGSEALAPWHGSARVNNADSFRTSSAPHTLVFNFILSLFLFPQVLAFV